MIHTLPLLAFPIDALPDLFGEELRALCAQLLREHRKPVRPRVNLCGARTGVSSISIVEHAFALGDELPRHLESDQAAAREAAKQIRTVRLDFAQLDEIVGGRLFEGFVRLSIAIEAAGLERVERPILAQQMGEMAEIEHVAEHACDDEQRSATGDGTRMHRHDMPKPQRGRGGRACVRRGGRGFLPGDVGATTDQLR